jgi:phosphoribosylformylglycinamidine (FGAM) synthase PurS component
MKYVVRARWEGDITVDAKSEDDAAEYVQQTFNDTSLYNTSIQNYQMEDPEILDVKIVSP